MKNKDKALLNVLKETKTPLLNLKTIEAACVNIERQFVGVEKDEAYFNAALKKLENQLK